MDEESESLAPPLTSITSLLTPQIASPISILSTEFEYLLPQYKELDTYPPSPFKISTSVPSVAEELNELNEVPGENHEGSQPAAVTDLEANAANPTPRNWWTRFTKFLSIKATLERLDMAVKGPWVAVIILAALLLLYLIYGPPTIRNSCVVGNISIRGAFINSIAASRRTGPYKTPSCQLSRF